MGKGEIVIAKTWRSEWRGLALLVILCLGSIYLTRTLPGSIIRGPLFPIGGKMLYLSLPLFWLPPFITFGTLLYRIYNVRYAINADGIEGKIGVLSLYQTVTRVRYEDIRAVETIQSLFERLLNIGTLEIWTAATGGVEILMEGIGSPREVQDMVLGERDRRQRLAVGRAKEAAKEGAKEKSPKEIVNA